MDLVQTYTRQITPDTPPADRLARSKALLDGVSQQMAAGDRYEDDTVTGVVTALLKVTLDSTHTTPELRDWLLSPEVREVVWALATGPGTASVILQGVKAAVSHKGVGWADIGTWSAVLANRWFVRPDSTVTPTTPGFVLGLFEYDYLCADRQEEVCGIRRANRTLIDTELLPLVSGALPKETGESINHGGRTGDTALHHATSVSCLPQISKALLAHREIKVNARNNSGKTPLIDCLAGEPSLDDKHLQITRVLLGDPRTDVTVLDKKGKTVLDHCLGHLRGVGEETVTVALEVTRMVCEHKSATPGMVTTGLEFLLSWEAPVSQRDLCVDVIVNLAANPKFDINARLRDGKTIGLLAASKGNGHVVLGIIKIEGFDSRAQDRVGNTVIHYVCERVIPEMALEILTCPGVNWDFTLTNVVSQAVLDYYLGSETPKNAMVKAVLQKHSPGTAAALPEVTPRPPRPTVDRPVRDIQWTTYEPGQGSVGLGTPGQVKVKVLPTTQEFVNTKRQGIAQNKVFRMTSAKKGKACIICVSKFLVGCLGELNGYTKDSEMLAELWSQLGYQVVTPNCVGDWHLTAEEIEHAVLEFSAKLDHDDSSTVVCLLSHGGQGYIYGSDGKTVSLKDLFSHLDNEKCPQMKKKPKVAIVQACAGSSADHGVAAGPSGGPTPEEAYSAANESPLPTMSDLIVCSPALPGYESYVRDRGSVFITHLVDVFARHAKADDIAHLMTWVNQAVSEEDIPVEHNTEDCKQMSRTESCLTKLLYFFPCPGGRGGQDWSSKMSSSRSKGLFSVFTRKKTEQ